MSDASPNAAVAVDSAADAKVRARALGAWHGVFKVAGVSLNTSGLSLD